MKKLSHMINNENAFYFPLVLLITILFLSTISTTVLLYRNELGITQYVINQANADTIIQMTRKKFITSEVYKEHMNGEIIYEFPPGTATLKYEQVDESIFIGHISIVTNDGFLLETVTHLVVKSD